MRIADRFAGHRAQAKTLLGVEAAALEAAVVEHQRFGLGMFDEQLAIVGAGERFGDERAHLRFVGVE
jgi:hypothetical protein